MEGGYKIVWTKKLQIKSSEKRLQSCIHQYKKEKTQNCTENYVRSY